MRRRKCKVCKAEYLPDRMGQVVCGVACSLTHHKEKERKARKQDYRARKAALKSKSDWLKEAQVEFNKFIRLRDQDKPCVSCGRYHNGQYHAGHYRTTKAQPALRFNEMNCHKQCQPCNTHMSGNITEYRIELVRRVGMPLVEWLEKDHPPCNWTIEEIKAVRDYYRRACKDFLACPENNPTPF